MKISIISARFYHCKKPFSNYPFILTSSNVLANSSHLSLL